MRAKVVWMSLAAIGSAAFLSLAAGDQGNQGDQARIARGFQIAPVKLKLKGRNHDLVGLGSYIVNAQGGCNDCHTNPPYAPGGDPYKGEPTKINTAGYLAGGMHFGDVVSANITPDDEGKPAGVTYQEFKKYLRNGHDPDEPDEILQVMPWPVFGNMTDHDLRAIYEYLSAIPSIGSHEEE